MNTKTERITLDVPEGMGDVVRKVASSISCSERHLWLGMMLASIDAVVTDPIMVILHAKRWEKSEKETSK